MRFRSFELPDDHVFLNRIRSLVDGYFKVAAWLAIAATFQVAAEATKSWLLWTICGLAYVMILLYLQSFISWLGKAKFGLRGWSIRDLEAGKRSKKRLVRWTSKTIVPTITFIVWAALMFAVQSAIDSSVTAIVEFQKSARASH